MLMHQSLPLVTVATGVTVCDMHVMGTTELYDNGALGAPIYTNCEEKLYSK